MTIGGWILFGFLALTVSVICGGFAFILIDDDKTAAGIATIFITFVIVIAIFAGLKWYYSSTASGQRELLDEKSNLYGGIERTINIYTANGDLIANYDGKIDIEANDGGYVKFDFDGKRYIYYNCFVETIADIK